jgi:MFS transporter, UMF1 family
MDKKIIRAWTIYDFANSAYNLIIASAIFPGYFTGIVKNDVQLFGYAIKPETIASWSISLAFLVVALISPLLSAIADFNGNKKVFMRAFCIFGSISCIALYFFKLDAAADGSGIAHTANVWYGVLFSVLACIGYCGSVVFYNAYLPEIAPPKEQDKISARGYIMGYIGSVSLLIVCLALILGLKDYNKAHNQIFVRCAFVFVGLWWFGWSIIPFRVLPMGQKKPLQKGQSIISAGYNVLGDVWKQIKKITVLRKYLYSYFFAAMGLQTVMYMATYFASKEIKLETAQLVITVLIINVVAIGGAYLFSKICEKLGNRVTLMILMVIWIGICISATYLVYTAIHFYILAFVVGMVMGGTQSLGRSTYSKLLPADSETNTSYFSFFDVVEKVSIVIGTLSFGLIAQATSMRNSAAALGVYFLIGLVLLAFTNMDVLKNQNKLTH